MRLVTGKNIKIWHEAIGDGRLHAVWPMMALTNKDVKEQAPGSSPESLGIPWARGWIVGR